MRPEQRQRLMLGALLVVLAVTLYLRWPSAASPAATRAARASRPPAAAPAATLDTPDVKLEALTADHTKPGDAERNLFKFKVRPRVVEAPPAPVAMRPAAPLAPPMPSGPPPPPPITLKFIGVLQSEGTARVALLSDGRGPLYGREGETVLGQYKILRIASESIEMSYLDGRGRQTIRLSGS